MREHNSGRKHSMMEREATVLGRSQRFLSEGQWVMSGGVFVVVTGGEGKLLASSG